MTRETALADGGCYADGPSRAAPGPGRLGA